MFKENWSPQDAPPVDESLETIHGVPLKRYYADNINGKKKR